MNARLTLTSALILATAAANAQVPFGTAVERARTQQVACEAAGSQAASMAKGNEIALVRSDGRARSVTFSPCECKEQPASEAWKTTWVCSRKWSLTARQ
jgi:hypothetical protein